jgi:hypothetical protein
MRVASSLVPGTNGFSAQERTTEGMGQRKCRMFLLRSAYSVRTTHSAVAIPEEPPGLVQTACLSMDFTTDCHPPTHRDTIKNSWHTGNTHTLDSDAEKPKLSQGCGDILNQLGCSWESILGSARPGNGLAVSGSVPAKRRVCSRSSSSASWEGAISHVIRD